MYSVYTRVCFLGKNTPLWEALKGLYPQKTALISTKKPKALTILSWGKTASQIQTYLATGNRILHRFYFSSSETWKGWLQVRFSYDNKCRKNSFCETQTQKFSYTHPFLDSKTYTWPEESVIQPSQAAMFIFDLSSRVSRMSAGCPPFPVSCSWNQKKRICPVKQE